MIHNLIDKVKLAFQKEKQLPNTLYEILGFYPHHLEIYHIALSHKSRAYRGKTGQALNNERLEYLGDAILEAVVSDIVFHRYPNKPEGFLTSTRSKIVQRSTLNRLAEELGLDRLIQRSASTRSHNSYIGGNAFEALIGAVYLDRGYALCKWFIEKRILGRLVDIDGLAHQEVNFKSKLLEWTQKNRIQSDYRMEELKNGDGNSPVFSSVVLIENITISDGKGYSKKESQQVAARAALTRLRREPQLIDRIFRSKEKRTAMEADEICDVPKIEEIEEEISRMRTSRHAKSAPGRREAAQPTGAAPRQPKSERKADNAQAQQPKSERKAENPQAQQPKSERKADNAQAQQPKSERKAENPQAQQPKSERKAENAQAQQPKSERKADNAQAQQPKSERKADNAQAQQPKAERKADNPQAQQPKAERKAENAQAQQATAERKADNAQAQQPKAERKADNPQAQQTESKANPQLLPKSEPRLQLQHEPTPRPEALPRPEQQLALPRAEATAAQLALPAEAQSAADVTSRHEHGPASTAPEAASDAPQPEAESQPNAPRRERSRKAAPDAANDAPQAEADAQPNAPRRERSRKATPEAASDTPQAEAEAQPNAQRRERPRKAADEKQASSGRRQGNRRRTNGEEAETDRQAAATPAESKRKSERRGARNRQRRNEEDEWREEMARREAIISQAEETAFAEHAD